MKIRTILTLLFLIVLNTGCASTDNTDFQDERKKKLDELNEDCDFATVEFGFPEDIYICYKSPTNIKKTKVDKSDDVIDEESDTNSDTAAND